MTRMHDVPQPECDLDVEDLRAQTMLTELLVYFAPKLVQRRYQVVPYGAASVGKALGQMVLGERFPRPSRVFLDGDQAASAGCLNLPGDDAPERVVFDALSRTNWSGVDARVGRPFADVADACSRATVRSDHHEWVQDAATELNLSGDILWQAMCAEWAQTLDPQDAARITQSVDDALAGIDEAITPTSNYVPTLAPFARERKPAVGAKKRKTVSATETGSLFEQLPIVPQE